MPHVLVCITIVCLFVCVLFVYVMMHGGFLFFVHLLFEIFVDGQ